MEELSPNLSSLSRVLTHSTENRSPEKFIKRALVAHGYFLHNGMWEVSSSSSSSPAHQADQRVAHNSSWEKLASVGGITAEDKKTTTQLISHYKEGREVFRLKEPRCLFAKLQPLAVVEPMAKPPLWPKEVECILQRTKFVTTPPPNLEPFYRPACEISSLPILRGDQGGTTVYTNPRGPQKCFKSARAGPSRNIESSSPRSHNDITLVFESRFESGNLGKAVQVGKWEYELHLSFDLYTNKHTQWFYFSVRNMRKGQTYRFTIVNLCKAGSLYNEGMQPVVYSMVRASRTMIGWRRGGRGIKYFKTPLRRLDTKSEAYYFGLTWLYTFEHNNDTCYFANCYPYTYSDLQDYLHAIGADPIRSKFCKQRVLCKSLAGNLVPLLTITSPVKSPEESETKRAVVITSRVHPGETNGSWMMKGLLDFLTGDSADARTLRNSFIFKVVPMSNPDGVIVGNYRCSLAGRDLNRNYRTSYKDSYPIVWHIKDMVQRLTSKLEVVLYCDLHGHSRKQNVFIYGCDDMENKSLRLKSRVFPRMLCNNTPSMFSYKSSKFGVHKSKESTGRVVMWREMGITNSYTMEATFCGSLLGKMAHYHFRTLELERMGHHFCDTLLDYCDPDQSKVKCIMLELEEEYRASILDRLATHGQTLPPCIDPLDISLSSVESSDAGSDSSESDGPPVHILAIAREKKKKKKLKSRRERNKQKATLKMSYSEKFSSASPPAAPVDHTSSSSIIRPSHSIHSQDANLTSGLGRGDKKGGTRVSVCVRQNLKSDTESVDKKSPPSVHHRPTTHPHSCTFSSVTFSPPPPHHPSSLPTTPSLVSVLQPPSPCTHVENIAKEYLKQGFSTPFHSADLLTYCSNLLYQQTFPPERPHPINICFVKSGVEDALPSNVSDVTSLPKLVGGQPAGRVTSQYMPNHLQKVTSDGPSGGNHADLASSPPAMPPQRGNNANIPANLSHLLKKIRPNLVGMDEKQPKKLLGQHWPHEKTREDVYSRSEVEVHASTSPPPLPGTPKEPSNKERIVQNTDPGSATSHAHVAEGSVHGSSGSKQTQTASTSAAGVAMLEATTSKLQSQSSLPTYSVPITLGRAMEHSLGTDNHSSTEPHSSYSSIATTVSSLTSSGRDTPSRTIQLPNLPGGPLLAGQPSSPPDIALISNSNGINHYIQPKLTHQQAPPTMKPLSPTSDTLNMNFEELKLTNHFSSSVTEHKHHVTKAVDDRQTNGKALQQASRLPDVQHEKRLLSQQSLLSTATGPVGMPNLALKENPFMDEPHPLAVARNDHCTRFNGVLSPDSTNHSKYYSGKSLLTLGEEAVVVVNIDEDLEYYSELECFRKKQNKAKSVSR